MRMYILERHCMGGPGGVVLFVQHAMMIPGSPGMIIALVIDRCAEHARVQNLDFNFPRNAS